MEVYILGNSSSPLPSVVSPITVPAYQASEAVIPLASGSSPIGIGSGSSTSTIAINEQSIQTFFISNAITTTVVLTYPTDQILILTINGIEYYQTLDWTLGSDEKTITFLLPISYSSDYGNSIVKVVYTQVATTSNSFLNGSQIFFNNFGTTIPYEDIQDAMVYIYQNSTVSGMVKTVNGVSPNGSGALTLTPGNIGAEPSLGNPSSNNYILSSTTAGVRSWVALPNSAVWGSITGTLSNQTDLNSALSGKESSLGNPGTSGYILSSTTGGTRSWIAPATNYISSLTTTGSSGSATVVTGTLNIPTYTLSGLGGQSSLSGTGVVVSTSGTITYLGYTSNNTGSYLVQRDSNGNASFNNFQATSTQTTATGQTITMTFGSSRYQQSIGSNSITYKLPDATYLINGGAYEFNNDCTGNLIIQNWAGTTQYTVPSGGYATAICTNNTTQSGVWDIYAAVPDNVTWGTSGTTITGSVSATTFNSLTLTSQSIGFTIAGGTTSKTLTINNTLGFSGTDGTTMTFPGTSKTLLANDGSNIALASQTTGDLIYASSSTALGRIAAVASGSLLASNGTGTVPQYISTIPSSILGNSTVYIGTTGIVLNRASAALTLAGITLTTPTLGVATATSINLVTITQPASSATLTIANTGSLITTGAFAITLAASAASTVTMPASTSAVMNYYTSAPATANLLAYSGAGSGLISYVAAPSVLSGLQQTTNGSAPVWTTATGTGAPVNAVSPVFTGTPTGVTWIQMPGSPTRVSSTQFTCSGSLSTLINYAAKGMIIKWTESATVRCAMIYSSSYGAPTTTINIVGDSMASIDSNSLMYCIIGAEQFSKTFVVAGTIGATGTDVANDWYAMEPYRVLGLDLWVGTAGTTNSTSVTITNGTGSVNIFGTVSLASTVAVSTSPVNGNGGSYYSVGGTIASPSLDRISLNITAIQTTPAVDLYALMYIFPTRYLNIP